MPELYLHQKEALKWLEDKPKSMLALEPGLGKSAIAVRTIKPGERVLIVCPASLKINWEREYHLWKTFDSPIKIIKKKSEDLPKEGIAIINFDLLGQKVKKRTVPNYDFKGFDRLIIDESHMLKNYKSIRSKIGSKLIKTIPNAVLLTGTPMNRPFDLYPVLYGMGAYTGSPDSFGFKFCEATKVYLGYREVWQFRGLSNEEDLRELLKPYMLRMRKEDVIDLPEKEIKVIALDLPVSKQEKKYSLSEIEKDPRPIGFEGLAELIHDQGIRKLPLVIRHIKMRLETEDKIFVVAKHTDVIDKLKEKLKDFNPVVLDGRCSSVEKQKSVDTFQNDKKCRIFIGQITAVAEGITLTAAKKVIIAEAEWSYTKLTQVGDRCHRIGQTRDVSVEILTINKSIDEQMLYVTLMKEDYIKKVIENG